MFAEAAVESCEKNEWRPYRTKDIAAPEAAGKKNRLRYRSVKSM